MKKRNIFNTAVVVIAIVSLVFNGYSVYKINDLQDQNQKGIEDPLKEVSHTTKKLVQTMSEIAIQSNSETGVEGESVEELKNVIYKMPQVEKKLAFIKGMSAEEGSVYLDLDEVEWLSGEDAENAAREDGVKEPESLPNDFYIRNASDEIERVKLEADVSIAELNGARHQSVDYTAFIGEELMDRLFHFTYVEGKVVLLEEQYRP